MPRPVRTVDDLIGKKVMVPINLLLPKSKWSVAFAHKTCKVVGVKQDRTGAITHIYVVKEKERKFDKRTGRYKVVKFLKTKKRIPVKYCTETVRRIRRKGNATFQWEFPSSNTVTIKAGVQWEGGMAPIAWWLNNQDLMPYNKTKRIDMNKKPAAPMFNLRF